MGICTEEICPRALILPGGKRGWRYKGGRYNEGGLYIKRNPDRQSCMFNIYFLNSCQTGSPHVQVTCTSSSASLIVMSYLYCRYNNQQLLATLAPGCRSDGRAADSLDFSPSL